MPRLSRSQRGRNKHQRAAYHEAGHAVVAIELRRSFRYVTIVADEECYGRLMLTKAPDSIDFGSDPDRRATAWIERDIAISLAGPVSEAIFTGRFNHIGASGDYG